MTPHIVIMTCPPRSPLVPSDIAAYLHYAIDIDKRGALHNAINAFEMGISLSETFGQPVTILQDDVIVCQNFGQYISRFLEYIESEKAIVKWFDPGVDKNPLTMIRPRLAQRVPETFTCSQAVTYSSYWARKILSFLQALRVLDGPPPVHGDDNWICECLRSYRKNYYAHRPSLVQHIGSSSLVAPGLKLEKPERVAHDFVGLDFDPLTWPTVSFNIL